MNNSFDRSLLSGYVDGELTAEETTLVETALQETPDLRAELQDIQAIRQALQSLPTPSFDSDIRAAVRARIAQTQSQNTQGAAGHLGRPGSGIVTLQHLSTLALAATVLLAVGWSLWHVSKPNTKNTSIALAPGTIPSENAEPQDRSDAPSSLELSAPDMAAGMAAPDAVVSESAGSESTGSGAPAPMLKSLPMQRSAPEAENSENLNSPKLGRASAPEAQSFGFGGRGMPSSETAENKLAMAPESAAIPQPSLRAAPLHAEPSRMMRSAQSQNRSAPEMQKSAQRAAATQKRAAPPPAASFAADDATGAAMSAAAAPALKARGAAAQADGDNLAQPLRVSFVSQEFPGPEKANRVPPSNPSNRLISHFPAGRVTMATTWLVERFQVQMPEKAAAPTLEAEPRPIIFLVQGPPIAVKQFRQVWIQFVQKQEGAIHQEEPSTENAVPMKKDDLPGGTFEPTELYVHLIEMPTK